MSKIVYQYEDEGARLYRPGVLQSRVVDVPGSIIGDDLRYEPKDADLNGDFSPTEVIKTELSIGSGMGSDEDSTHTMKLTQQNQDPRYKQTPGTTFMSHMQTFVAGLNGTLTGDAEQNVMQYQDSTTVTAVADGGFIFVNWTDSHMVEVSTGAAIVIGDVIASETYTANFIAL